MPHVGLGGVKRSRGTIVVFGMIAAVGVGNLALGFDQAELAQYLPLLLKGVATTAYITLVTFTIGSLIALPIAIAAQSKMTVLKQSATAYFYLFRYTPLLAQLYLVYYGSGELSGQLRAMGLWWMFSQPLNCVLVVFTLNTSAYQAYLLAGAIQNLPKGQSEAASALGLRPNIALWKILLPQALLIALRPLGNELTKMTKASSIASVVTIFDLLGSTKLIYSDTFNFNYFLVCGLIYIALVESTRVGVEQLSSRLVRHLT